VSYKTSVCVCVLQNGKLSINFVPSRRGGKGGGGLLVAGYIDLIHRAICARLTACNLPSRQKEMNFCLYSSFFQHLQKLFKKGSQCHLKQQKNLGFDVWWIYKKKLQILLFSKLK